MYRFQTVLHTVFGFDRIFSGFSVLDDFFYGFAVSNRSQCHPPKRATLVLWHIKLQLAVRKLLRAGRFYTRGHKFSYVAVVVAVVGSDRLFKIQTVVGLIKFINDKYCTAFRSRSLSRLLLVV